MKFRSNVIRNLLCALFTMVISHSASAAPALGGWFVKTEINPRSSRLICTYYLFFPSGHLYFGNPPLGSENINFTELNASHPENCGSFTLAGETLTLTRNNGTPPEIHTYSPGAGGIMDSCPLQPCWRFKDGTRIEGQWGIDTAITSPGFSASASTTFVFHKDGSVETSGHAGVDERNATSLGASNGTGTYSFSKGKLVIKLNDGSSQTSDVFGVGSITTPRLISIDGIEYTGK